MPRGALSDLGRLPFGFYVHVPFCSVRCGYCDFNTYTAAELGAAPGASRSTYAHAAIAEIRLARSVLGDRPVTVDTVFFGGGTPTLLPPDHLGAVLTAIRQEFDVSPAVEVTTESNPDSVTAADLALLRSAGLNRISFGMQSAVPSVLATLDRTHAPHRLPAVVASARAAGFEQLSLDLIYGTPGESVDDWRTSVEAALALEPDHVSAYALVVEQGTALARRVARGDVAAPDDDDLADKYELADDLLASAGYAWYEVSNWARHDDARCRHNLGYWRSANWWGIGPGAHSHISGVRWWNVRHPAAYAERVAGGVSPAAAREVLTADTRHAERVLLESRLAAGLPLAVLDLKGRGEVDRLVDDRLVELVNSTATSASPGQERLVLTRRGRLLADTVVRALLG